MKTPLISTLVILGYGAPSHPELDRALGERLTAALETLRGGAHIIHLVLCGGHTNNPSLTEAEAMMRWLTCHASELLTTLKKNGCAIEVLHGTSTKAHMLDLAALYSGQGMAVVCQDTHAPVVRMYLETYFPKSGAIVIPIPTEHGRKPMTRVTRTAAYLLELFALHDVPLAERLRAALRQHAIDEARQKHAAGY